MSTLSEIEAALPSLNAEELATLEKIVQAERLKSASTVAHSVLDIPVASVGAILAGAESDDLLGEMLDDRK